MSVTYLRMRHLCIENMVEGDSILGAENSSIVSAIVENLE
jgi:hypothetical protein